ncbi:cell adhesion molecule 3-like [Phymastichus coffea]|uniref:cell adhesion molecule 3-like n=1 Tax=Phymastichus coffea TaxID=108790 RepID=UPI00273A873C|nr:cell adhesion molecule 3-like [Phymastichus coffea]
MNSHWIVVGLALLCFAQVWAKPASKDDGSDYQEDDVQEEREVDYSEGPVVAISPPQTLFVPPGASVFLPCEIQNTDQFAIEWRTGTDVELYVDNLKLTQNPDINKELNNTLVIRNVKVGDTGEYKCRALTNPPVTILHKVFVQSEGITVLPSDKNDVDQGASLTLTCQAGEDIKPLAMYWSRAGQRLKGEESKVKGQIFAISLNIKNATRHLAGVYQCVVEVGANNPIIKYISLKVRHAPEIEYAYEEANGHKHHISHYSTSIGTTVNITCLVHAHPGVNKLVWIHNGNEVKIDSVNYFKDDKPKSHHTLGIRNVTKNDFGIWQCRAHNVIGLALGPEITLNDAPGQPRFESGEGIEDSIELRWKVFSFKPINKTEFLYRKHGETEWKHGVAKVDSSIGKEQIIITTIKNISGKHEAKVRASNDDEHLDMHDVVWGPYSDIKKFDGEHGETKALTGGSSGIPNVMWTLIFIIAPLAYVCL